LLVDQIKSNVLIEQFFRLQLYDKRKDKAIQPISITKQHSNSKISLQ